jgi:ketosteroid isomerase-like protein
MSQENVEVVRASIDAVQQGDAATALSFFSDEVVFEPLVAGPYRGHAGVVKQWSVFMEEFDDYSFESEELIDAGDAVVLFWRHGGIGKASGIRVENDGATVFTLRNGQISHARVYADRAHALEAAGLSE